VPPVLLAGLPPLPDWLRPPVPPLASGGGPLPSLTRVQATRPATARAKVVQRAEGAVCFIVRLAAQ
jgi:hypothetical protein